jgi:formate dehydrogenase maturation protein FdhE
MMRDRWDMRIHRADELASMYPFAAEALRFYSQLAAFQRSLYAHVEKALADGPKASGLPLRDDLDLFLLLPRFSPFLAVIEQIAPLPVKETAASLAQQGPARWRQLIEDFWKYEGSGERNGTPSESWLAWTFLQPYAEYLAGRQKPVSEGGAPLTCPLCGARPIVGVLRGEGEGAKKSLICMLCAHEWVFRRIYCPACGEEREPQMAFYSAPEIAHVRVDVCDTCHTYLKSIDLTKTGLAVPIVDELATIPLDLWAREHGYEKLQTNLLGT